MNALDHHNPDPVLLKQLVEDRLKKNRHERDLIESEIWFDEAWLEMMSEKQEP